MRHKKVKTCSRCKQAVELVRHRTICHTCNLARKRAVAEKKQNTDAGAAYNRETTAAYRRTPLGRAGLLIFFASKRAKEANRPFNLTRESIASRIAAGKCEVTGLPFDLSPGPDKHHANPWAPSLDRRDSTGGYTEDNVQVVCAAYNYAKSEWTGDVLLKLARAIVDASG
jgi:hypothetical protein